MDKKIKYTRFRHIADFWLDMLEEFKKDVVTVLQEGPIDLTKCDFSQNPYYFYQLEQTLYPHKAYLDDDKLICIEAFTTPNPKDKRDKGFVLSLDDMSSDMIILSDFMDCVYDNVSLRYDTELEQDLESSGAPCQLLGIAEAVLTELSERSADKGDHQDIVNFLSDCAENAKKWKRVKRLVYNDKKTVDWDDAVEQIQP